MLETRRRAMQRLVQPSLHPCASTTKVRSFFSLAPLSATSALSQGHRLVRTEPVQASLALPTQSAGRSYHSPPSRHQVFSFFGGDRADDNNKTKDKDGDIAKSGDVMDDAMQDEDMFDDDEDYEEESIFQDIDLNDGNIIHQSHSQFSSDIRVVEYGYGIRELVIGQSNATSSTANSHGKSNGDPAASSAAEHRPSQLAAGYHLTQSLVKLKEPQLLLLPHTMQIMSSVVLMDASNVNVWRTIAHASMEEQIYNAMKMQMKDGGATNTQEIDNNTLNSNSSSGNSNSAIEAGSAHGNSKDVGGGEGADTEMAFNEQNTRKLRRALIDQSLTRALVLGLGGGALPMYVQHFYPNASIDCVELDPQVITLARSHFGFTDQLSHRAGGNSNSNSNSNSDDRHLNEKTNTKIETYNEDAVTFVASVRESYVAHCRAKKESSLHTPASRDIQPTAQQTGTDNESCNDSDDSGSAEDDATTRSPFQKKKRKGRSKFNSKTNNGEDTGDSGGREDREGDGISGADAQTQRKTRMRKNQSEWKRVQSNLDSASDAGLSDAEAIEGGDGAYELIIQDASPTLPSPLLSSSFMQSVYDITAPGGMYIQNVACGDSSNAYLSGVRLTESADIVKRTSEVFEHVYTARNGGDNTLIVVALKAGKHETTDITRELNSSALTEARASPSSVHPIPYVDLEDRAVALWEYEAMSMEAMSHVSDLTYYTTD